MKCQKYLFQELSGMLLLHFELDIHWIKLEEIKKRLLTCFRLRNNGFQGLFLIRENREILIKV